MRRPANPTSYARAARILRAGGLVALPTETVYGLAGDATSDAAVAKVYALKGRPADNPLITHIAVPEDASLYGHVTPVARTLIDAFWPGPLTVVIQAKPSNLSPLATKGLDTLALRCPDAAWTAHLAGPVVMPSANLSGHVSPTTADHVAADFGDRVDLIVDGGPCPGGIESTVVAAHGAHATILRPGAVAEADIAAIVALGEGTAVGSPGLLLKHYAPRATLRLNATDTRPGETRLHFGGGGRYTLSATGDLVEAARNLYAQLRRLDDDGIASVAVDPIPERGLGTAINDRLRRAARGR